MQKRVYIPPKLPEKVIKRHVSRTLPQDNFSRHENVSSSKVEVLKKLESLFNKKSTR